jgi:hypothetical protein
MSVMHNPAVSFYGVSVFFVFVIWFLWKYYKSFACIATSLKEIAKNSEKSQS